MYQRSFFPSIYFPRNYQDEEIVIISAEGEREAKQKKKLLR